MKITIEGDNVDNNVNLWLFDELKVYVDDDLSNMVVMGITANTIMIAVMMTLI